MIHRLRTVNLLRLYQEVYGESYAALRGDDRYLHWLRENCYARWPA